MTAFLKDGTELLRYWLQVASHACEKGRCCGLWSDVKLQTAIEYRIIDAITTPQKDWLRLLFDRVLVQESPPGRPTLTSD